MTASIGKITNANKGYHLSEITDAVDSYYLKDRPVRAIGSLAPTLGLGPEVTSDEVLHVLSGMSPDGTTKLRERQVKTLGFDLAMSARKEISILHALGNAQTRAEIEAAHRAATEASFAYLESAATFVRRGAGGLDVLPGQGLVAFTVTHTDSRNLDPQLHEHVLIANLTKGPDDRWTALHGREIYRHAKTAGFVYQAVLRAELTERVGLVWGDVHNGTAPVVGFDPELVREFSTRRRGIEEALERNGLSSPKSAAIATLTTRQAKQADVDLYDLQHEWTRRAEPYMDSLRSLPLNPRQVAIGLDESAIAATVTEQHATFDRRALVQAVCAALPDGGRLDDINHATDRFLHSGHAIALGPDRWTTPEILGLEQRTVAIALDGRNRGHGLVPVQLLDEALAARPSLGPDQAAAVSGIAMSGNAVDGIIGPAGHGKSTMLDAARAAWLAAGYTVIGAAPSARAAAELQASAGIPSQTIDRFLSGLASGYEQLSRQSVLVIDEAGMVGTRKLARVIDEAHRASAKVVLVGDNRQLPEIDAGGLFSALMSRLDVHTLTENRRQRDPTERIAVAELRAGHIEAAMARLQRHGRVTTADNIDVLRDGLVADWHTARTTGSDALMLAPRRSMVDDLNDRARALLRSSGQLGPPIARIDDLELAAGDQVVALRNDYTIGILNGDRGTVERADHNGITVTLRRGGEVTLPFDYLDDGHLIHGYATTIHKAQRLTVDEVFVLGYATTIHKAQGLTVDEVFVLGDDTYAHEHGYTALTRGRDANRVYLVQADPPEHDLPHQTDAPAPDPLDAFMQSLHHSAAKTAAIDFAPPDHDYGH